MKRHDDHEVGAAHATGNLYWNDDFTWLNEATWEMPSTREWLRERGFVYVGICDHYIYGREREFAAKTMKPIEAVSGCNFIIEKL